jgi:hypothetical protein
MIKKLLGRLVMRVLPYWCPHCPRRYRTEKRFHLHYMQCRGRLLAVAREEKAFEAMAPKNRQQKRKMAKKAGRIKDWGELNAP